MARIIDREPFIGEQRFFFRSSGGLVLSSRQVKAVGHVLQSKSSISSGCGRIAVTPVVSSCTSWLSKRFLSKIVRHSFPGERAMVWGLSFHGE